MLHGWDNFFIMVLLPFAGIYGAWDLTLWMIKNRRWHCQRNRRPQVYRGPHVLAKQSAFLAG
jgi:hypothetical protein